LVTVNNVPLRVVAAGASGFIGRALCAKLLEAGAAVTILTRGSVANRPSGHTTVSFMNWHPGNSGEWQRTVGEADVVVNLAGESVAGRRWTVDRKEAIRRSRLDATNALVANMSHGRLISASAVGYYGDAGDKMVDETAPRGSGFLADVCAEWEAAANTALEHNIKVAIFRIGIVLGAEGGALPTMLHPPFLPFSPWRLGLGGPLGNGNQWMPWIHIDDAAAAMAEAVINERYEGTFNLTAPNPVTNREFSRTLGRAINRPAIIPLPGFLLRLLLGEFSSSLLTGQRAIPSNLQNIGFNFRYTSLLNVLTEVTRKI
jgi:uncharacterized protein (TIGR01777 family)